MAGGKSRVFAFFQKNHTEKETADFLKQEYGIGGRSNALSGAGSSWESYDGKGLHYKKDGCPDVHFTWEQVAKRIAGLIQKGRYLTGEEQAEYDKIQAEKTLGEAEDHSFAAQVMRDAEAIASFGSSKTSLKIWRERNECGDLSASRYERTDQR